MSSGAQLQVGAVAAHSALIAEGIEPAAKSPHRRAWSRRVAADIVAFVDLAAIAVGGLLPAAIYAHFGAVETNWLLILQSIIVAALLSHVCLDKWGMYDTTRIHDFPQRPWTLLSALGVALVAVVGIGLPYAVQDSHVWIWYAVWFFASATLMLLNRGLSTPILARLAARGTFNQRVAVFGAGPIARRVHDYLSDPRLDITFVGVYDDRIDEARLNPEGLGVAGKLDDLIEAARGDQIDRIVIALPQSADKRIAHVARRLEQLPVSLHIVTHISSDLIEASQHRVSSIGGVGLLDVKAKPLADWAPLVKRAEDLLIASSLLIILAPLMALIAAAVRLDSAGPVFYRQRRHGLNHRVIEILKFRTLHVVESDANVRQVVPNDPRVTRIGRILRRTSLDELPQLINVVTGEMSLVGPRPHALVHNEQYGRVLEEYANRHQVKPGITGLAQVKGLRGETTSTDKMQARVAEDISYIKSWSLWLDLEILARTLWIVVAGRNAH